MMLARLALSRGAKLALSLLIVVLAAVLVFSLLSGKHDPDNLYGPNGAFGG